MDKSLSIRHKINLILGAIFLTVLVVVISIAVSSEKQLSREMIEERLQEKASSYLDTLNMLMISGAIHNRELLREKILSDNNIVDARALRAPSIDKIYQRGYDHEYPVDDLDRRALAGEEILISNKSKDGHIMTYLMPILAYKDYRGTNCLTCHMVEENEILGAIRISYSLDELDQNIFNNMLRMGLVQAAMFIVGLLILGFVLRQVVTTPISRMKRNISGMEQNSDLTVQLEVGSRDEIGLTAQSINSLIDRFAYSLRQLVQLSAELEQSADHIERSSSASTQAANAQREETANIQQAIADLRGSTQHVMNNAQESSLASSDAKKVARLGVNKTELASSSIDTMNQALLSASQVIHTLDERSKSVGSVLEVIKGIAEQTNLLALNAAIEAARAGESGRGFAVVADEVRTLAQRTAESTQEIEQMIDQLQSEAKLAVQSMENAQTTATEGMERVHESASALYSMAEHVERMSTLNNETLKSMETQVIISDQVNQRVESISDYSINSSSTAEQTTAIAKQLVAIAHHLSQLVNQFKV